MNQRDDMRGREHAEPGRETDGGREFSDYERDSYGQEQQRAGEGQERWHGGFERPPSYRSRRAAGRWDWPRQGEYDEGQGGGQQGYAQNEQRYGPRSQGQGRSESDRYRPVTEEWEAARGYGDLGRYEGDPRGGSGDYAGSGGYPERGYRTSQDRWDEGSRQGRYSGWTGRSPQSYSPQSHHGSRAYWHDRPAWQDQYGFGQGRGRDPYSRHGFEERERYREGRSSSHSPGQYGREHSGEQWLEREPFRRAEDVHYYGTGAPGWGGPGFTGGAYGYGYAPRYPTRSLESEYSDEAAVGYEGSHGRGRGMPSRQGTGMRQYARGPKGYQRSDERLKEDISERLMEAHDIDSSEVTVEVKGAKVILEGVVPSRHMKHAIEDMVDACPGVQDIDNRIRVSSPNYQGAISSSDAASGAQTSRASASQAGTPSATTVTQTGAQGIGSSQSQSGSQSGAGQSGLGGSSNTGAASSTSTPGGNAGSQANNPTTGPRTRQ